MKTKRTILIHVLMGLALFGGGIAAPANVGIALAAGDDAGRAAAPGAPQLPPLGVADPCLPSPPHLTDGPPPPPTDQSPREEPPGSAPDASWPIVAQWTATESDPGGMAVAVTYVLRRNPNSPAVPQSTVAGTSCTYVADESLQSTHTIQGITQYLKTFYYRYTWASNGLTYRAYRIYLTQEYWTRTSTAYTVGQNTTTWTFNGWDCSNVYQTNGSTGHLTPNWYTSTRSYDYFYDFTKNWSIRTPGAPIGFGNITTQETAPAYKNGSSIGTLSTRVRLYGS